MHTTADTKSFTIFPCHNLLFPIFVCSVDSQHTGSSGHLLQQQSVFAASGRPEFCLVALSSGRNRHYFIVLLENHGYLQQL